MLTMITLIEEKTHREPTPSTERLLGKGRSALVYRARSDDGQSVARKVFEGEWLANLVHVLLHGAPNPYTWSDKAIGAVVARRELLATLVEYWFDDKLRLPTFVAARWNPQARAYEIQMELITGRPAALHHAFSADRDGELRDLHHRVMKPLQRHLIQSGFDGLVWQAGMANPVAASNFLLDSTQRTSSPAVTGPNGIKACVDVSENDPDRPFGAWVWIDLESGVPALFPLNPWALMRFYLPKSLQHGGPLFDDVDEPKLTAYLQDHRDEMIKKFGQNRFDRMLELACQIGRCQHAWRSMRRIDRSVTCAHKRGKINQAQADSYRQRPIAWYSRLFVRGVKSGFKKLGRKIRSFLSTFTPRWIWSKVCMTAHFLVSQKYRARIGRVLVVHRIASWARRRQLFPHEARVLRLHVKSEEATEYLADFGIHLAIKPLIKFSQWVILPALHGAGVISLNTMMIGIVSGGLIGRTVYTLFRLIQMTMRGREKPWIALMVGCLPVVGNAAYPAQIIYTSTERDHDVARFILYDLFTWAGRALPIWGGPDTMTEHFFNRWPSVVFPAKSRRLHGEDRLDDSDE